MIKYSEIIGLPVICADNGKKAGIVSDIIFCTEKKEVKGLVLERKGCEISCKFVNFRDILNLGRDAVIINSLSSLEKLNSSENKELYKSRPRLTGLKVYTQEGQDIGTADDVLFDGTTGRIEGIEVSDGIIRDILSGRNIIPLFGKVEFSQENMLVGKEAIEEMEGNGRGIKNLLK